MSAAGQKQEVRYLAMAIGALVVAVALFVGVRSLSNKPATASSNSSAKKEVAKDPEKQAAKKEKEESVATTKRDPFAAVGAAEVQPVAPRNTGASARPTPRTVSTGGGQDLSGANLRLSGILRGSSATAVIHIDDARYYANLGEQVGGFTLVKIGTNSVVLSQGGQYYTLTIQPEPSSGSRRTTNRRR